MYERTGLTSESRVGLRVLVMADRVRVRSGSSNQSHLFPLRAPVLSLKSHLPPGPQLPSPLPPALSQQ